MNTAIECNKCVNTTANPVITINSDGLCQICAAYQKNFQVEVLKAELAFLVSLRRQTNEVDCLVGLSGGKDSTASLITILELGFRPKAFTLNSGYYPPHIFTRSSKLAKQLAVDHATIDIRDLIRPYELACFHLFAQLYEMDESEKTKAYFRELYTTNRRHYSVNDTHIMPFVRSCQICRKIVIRAYYEQAIKNNVSLVILGMNEWAGLSHNQFSAIRKLQPHSTVPPVYIVHLPFLLQRTAQETKAILSNSPWDRPVNEAFIESNSNSCLLARSTEAKATRLLGFHPDTMRLAREVTVGFLTKAQAKKSLNKFHLHDYSAREVLHIANLI